MPTYTYKHPKTGEFFEDIRPFSKANEPFIAPDGVRCENVPWWSDPDNCGDKCKKHSKGLIDKKCEVWEKDSAYVKSVNPKYVRTQSGHRIRYDPTKHC